MAATNLPETKIIGAVESAWGGSLQPAGCLQCGQAFLVESSRIGQVCPNCAQGQLESQPAQLRSEPPELVIPFEKKRPDVQATLANFVKEVWLRPDDLNAERLLERIAPVYWPMWLVDSDVSGSWKAEIGFDYQVKSSQESYAGGGWHSKEVIETRIRWEPRLGKLSRHYNNISAPALSNHKQLLEQTGGYRSGQAEPYSAEEIGHAVLHLPDLQPESAWPLAQTSLQRASAEECRQAATGQHVRNFAIQAEYSALNWTQLLHPLFTSYYSDDQGHRHPIYINGQNGTISGVRMASQRKGWIWAGILIAIAVIFLLLGVLGFVLSPMLPALSVIGILFEILAFVIGVSSLIPAIYPWQWNRRQKERKIVRA